MLAVRLSPSKTWYNQSIKISVLIPFKIAAIVSHTSIWFSVVEQPRLCSWPRHRFGISPVTAFEMRQVLYEHISWFRLHRHAENLYAWGAVPPDALENLARVSGRVSVLFLQRLPKTARSVMVGSLFSPYNTTYCTLK